MLLEFVPVRRMDSPVLLNEYRWLEYSYPNDNFRHWALLFLQVSRRLKYQIEYIPFNSNCLSITIGKLKGATKFIRISYEDYQHNGIQHQWKTPIAFGPSLSTQSHPDKQLPA